jgi:hypothetical protein
MRIAALALVAVALAAAPADAAKCDPNGADNASVAAARADVAASCGCAAATSHAAYKSCVKTVMLRRVGLLSSACAGLLKRCASKSTCGRPGAVTCCRTSRTGKTRCAIKRSAELCRPPAGGTASVGTEPSCCDACGGIFPGPVCGNGVVEASELCDDEGIEFGTTCSVPKTRCRRPGEDSSCQECCGLSVGEGGSTGLICIDDDMCCGFCANWGDVPNSFRCADCVDAACSCGTNGAACREDTCCPGYECRPVGQFQLWACCGSTGNGCGSGADCCSGVCTAGACE